MEKYDIIGLTATWIEEKEEEWIQNKLEGYTVKSISAVRENKKRRAKGGIAVAIRNGISVIEEEEEQERRNGREIITENVKVDGIEMIIIIRYMREKREENWEIIERIAEKNAGTAIIIGCDFKARTAEDGGRTTRESPGSKSKDKKINLEGEDLIKKIRDMVMHIMNVDSEKDSEEEWTYLEGGGKSVIDYIITNKEGRE